MPRSVRKADRLLTYADYCRWPEAQRCELIDGVVFDMTPAPSRSHADLSLALFRLLDAFFQGKPCRTYLAPLDVRLPRDDEPDDDVQTVVQPDLLVVCDEKKLDDRGCRGAPDLVIEVLSPATASKDHIVKRRLYEQHKVKEYWLVSPTDRILTIYRLGSDGEFGKPDIFADTDEVEAKLFPGLVVDLAKVFPALPKVVREDPRKYL